MCALALAVLLLASWAAAAQEFPNKPVRIVVPWPPSGNVDITARTLAPTFGEALGQQVIVESMGVEVMDMPMPDFAAFVRADYEKWRRVAREGNIVVD